MNFIDAVALQIRRDGKSVVTWFDVEQVIRRLFRERRFDDKPLKLRRDHPSSDTFAAVRQALVDPRSLQLTGPLSELVELESVLLKQATESGGRLLTEDPEFQSKVWRVAGVPDGTAEEICCLVDPWCYVSHLSAMQRWGFSNRTPLALHLTRPARAIWQRQAQAELRRLPPAAPGDVPKARARMDLPSTLRKRELRVFQPSYLGRSVPVADSHARMATVGQTFWDSVQEPRRCGSMTHVIEMWEERAGDYIEEIVTVFEDKEMPTSHLAFCRAGYLLEEVVGTEDQRVADWRRFGKQGGSAKLDPEAPFATRHSERWNLSLNV